MRLHLTLGLITILALVLTLRAERGHRFTFAQAEDIARKRAAAKYVPLPDAMPPQLKQLTPQQDAGIFWKDSYRLWRKKGLPFQVDFYHQLNSNPQPHVSPEINTADRKGSHPWVYSPRFFNFIDLAAKPPAPFEINPPLPPDLGYAGFYVRYPDMGIGSNPDSLDGFFSALGCSYFRALAKEQVYGLSARGLAIDTAMENNKPPEEFPIFTDWWLQEPAPNATELVADAILDSPSVSGAYEFTIHPGAVTSVDVHASLFFRQKADKLGLAPFSSMYLYGENAKDHFNDNVHPEIHDSDGVLVNTGAGDWEWHPLQQTPFLQRYSFHDENPKGFGVLQRDRDFQHYQDLNNKYNVRPSAWVTTHGNWGKGKVQLAQLNSNDFNTDNVVVFWRPDQPVNPGDHIDVSYTIDFYMNDAARPPLAYTKQTLINAPAPPPPPPVPTVGSSAVPPAPPTPPAASNTASKPTPAPASAAKPATNAAPVSPQAKPPVPPPTTPATPPPPPTPAPPTGTVPVQFLVDFAGNGIENIPANQPPELELTYLPPGTYLREKSVEKNGYDNSWRVTFTIIPLKHFVPTQLRCRLLQNHKPITETWCYTWHQ
jgi:periplasmic glucans biosynthesis protein